MKRFLLILFFAMYAVGAHAAEGNFDNVSTSCSAVTATGVCGEFNVHPPDYVHIPSVESFTWQTIIAGGTATTVSVTLQGSIDDVTWSTLDTSTSTSGETRTKATAAVKFFRCNVGTYNRNGTTLTCNIMPTRTTGGASSGGAWGSITGTLSDQTDLQTALNLLAPIASPTFTGTLTAPIVNTSGSNGGLTGIEGTGAGLTPASGTDLLYPDSSSHCWHASLNNVDVGCLSTASNTITLTNKTLTAPTIASFANATHDHSNSAGGGNIPEGSITSLTSDLALKAPLASPTFTGTVGGVTKSMVGLGSVDNTSDAGKPVSTAQQTSLDLKANLASPTLTGTPAAPTAAVNTNTTQLATTAFVIGQGTVTVHEAWCNGTIGTSNGATYGLAPGTTSTSESCTVAAPIEIPMPIACTAKNLYARAGTAATTGTSVTLYKGGSAQTLTVALGTGTTVVSDTTHTVSFSAGDLYSIRATTGQATETTANIRASFVCQ